MIRPCALVGSAALVGLLAVPAQAVPITEQTLIATGGNVIVTFLANGAGFTSELFLDGALGEEFGAIFNNATTEVGASVDLGSFTGGTELIFKLLVKQTGDTFYTGFGDRNVDGTQHAAFESGKGQVFVGFEDLFGGGDFDYDDLVFSLTNVVFAEAPGSGGVSDGGPGGGELAVEADEPGTLVLFGAGLSALVVAMKRRAA